MADVKQYIVEYLVQANVQNAVQNLSSLTGMMEEFQAKYGAGLRQSSVAADRIIKSAKNLGKNLGKQLDMSGPISQMQAFQGALISTFNGAHKVINSMFAGDMNAMQRHISGLQSSAFLAEKQVGRIQGTAKKTSSEIRQLNSALKSSQQTLSSYSNVYERFANGIVGKGDKSKFRQSVLKQFTEDERKAIAAATNDKNWMTASGARLQKALDNFKNRITTLNKDYASKKAALDERIAENKSKASVVGSNSVVANPLLMSAEEMEKKVAATRKMVRSMSKLIADQKGKPKTITYTATLNINDAVAKLTTLQEQFTKLQSMANISVRVRGAGAAKGFKGYLDDINKGVKDLQTTLSTVATAPKTPKARRVTKKDAVEIPAKLTFSTESLKSKLAKVKLTLPVTLVPTLGDKAARKKNLEAFKTKIPPVKVKIDITQAKAKFDEFVRHIQRFRNQTINLNATAGARYRTGRNGGGTTVQPPGGGVGGTTTQPASGRRGPVGQRTYGRGRGVSMYPLVGNTSFGVQTPAFVGMAKGMVGMMGIGAAFGLIGDAMRQAVEYQNTMASVKAILESNKKLTGYTPANFRAMEKNIRKVGMDTKFTAPEVAGAARFMAMAGLSVEQINNSIRPIADVALIGDNDLQTTADKITNIQTAFGLGKNPQQMRKLADNLTTTFTRFNTDMMMTAEAMQYAAPIASAAGLGIEETLAMIGVMGNAGIQSSMAGTTLRMALQNVINPNKKQKKLWDAMGIQRFNKDGSVRNIVDILSDLSEHADDKNLVKLVSGMFRVTSMAGVTQIIRNLDKVKATRDDMKLGLDSGISERLSLEKQNTVAGLWAQVTSAFTEDNVQMFEKFQGSLKEMLISVRDYLKTPEAAENLNNIMELIKTMGSAFGKVAKIWLGIYNTFPGAVKAMMVIQFALNQFGLLLNPFIGLYRVIRNMGLALGVTNTVGTVSAASGIASSVAMAGAGTAAGVGIMRGAGALNTLRTAVPINPFPGQMMAMMNPVAAAPLMSGQTAFQNAVLGGLAMNYMPKQPGAFMSAFRNARAAGSFGALARGGAGVLSGVAGTAGSVLGAIFSPIGLAVAGIGATLGGIYYLNSYLNEKVEEFKNSVENDNAIARQLANENSIKTRGLLEQVLGKPIAVSPVATNEDGTITGVDQKTLGDMFPSIFNSKAYQLADVSAREKLYETFIAPTSGLTGFSKDAVMGYHRVRGLMGSKKIWNMDADELRRQALIAQVMQTGMESSQVTSIIENMTKAVEEWEKLPTQERNAQYSNLLTQLTKYRIDIPRSRSGLDIMGIGSYEEMSGLDPVHGNIMQYWMGVNKGVEDMLKENPLLERVKAVYELSQNVKTYSDEWFTAMGHLLGTMTVALPNDEGVQNMLLAVDTKGRVDWGKLLGENIDKLHLKVTNDVFGHIEILRGIYDKMTNDPFLSKFADQDFYKNLLQSNLGGIFQLDSSNQLSNKIDQRELDAYNKAHPGEQIGMMQVWGTDSSVAQKVRNWTIQNELNKRNIPNPLGTNNNTSGGNNGKTNPYQIDQSGYSNKYQRPTARPTQIVFNIENLCNFDKNEFLSADEKKVADQIMPRVIHAVTQAVATAQTQIGAMPDAGNGSQV